VKSVVSVTLQPLYTLEKSLASRRLDGSRGRSGHSGKQKYFHPRRESNPDFSGRPVRHYIESVPPTYILEICGCNLSHIICYIEVVAVVSPSHDSGVSILN
jgi:hypothetical protein